MADFVFVDQASVDAAAEGERQQVMDELSEPYLSCLSSLGFCKKKPVYVCSPYDVPVGPHRKMWMEQFVQLRETKHFEDLQYLVYSFTSQSFSLESKCDILSVEEGEKEWFRTIPFPSTSKQSNAELTREEQSIVDALAAYNKTKKSGGVPLFNYPAPEGETLPTVMVVAPPLEGPLLPHMETFWDGESPFDSESESEADDSDSTYKPEEREESYSDLELELEDSLATSDGSSAVKKKVSVKDRKSQSPLRLLPIVMEVAPPLEEPPLFREKTTWWDDESDFGFELPDSSSSEPKDISVKKIVSRKNKVSGQAKMPASQLRQDKHGLWEHPTGPGPKNHLWNSLEACWVEMKPQELMKKLEDSLPFNDSNKENFRDWLEQLDACDVKFEDVNMKTAMPAVCELTKNPVLGKDKELRNLAKNVHSKLRQLYCHDLVKSWKNAVAGEDRPTALEKFESFIGVKNKNLDDFPPGLRNLVHDSLRFFDNPNLRTKLRKLDEQLDIKLLTKDLEDNLPFNDSNKERFRFFLEQLNAWNVEFEDVNMETAVPAVRKLKNSLRGKDNELHNLAEKLYSKLRQLYCHNLVKSWKNAVAGEDQPTALGKFKSFIGVKNKNLDDFPLGLCDLVRDSLRFFDNLERRNELCKLGEELNDKLSKERV